MAQRDRAACWGSTQRQRRRQQEQRAWLGGPDASEIVALVPTKVAFLFHGEHLSESEVSTSREPAIANVQRGTTAPRQYKARPTRGLRLHARVLVYMRAMRRVRDEARTHGFHATDSGRTITPASHTSAPAPRWVSSV